MNGLSDKIQQYIEGRAAPKIEELSKKIEKERKQLSSPDEQQILEQKFLTEKNAIKEKFTPHKWLDDAARRASQLTFATHPVKFTSPLIKKATSCYCHDTSTTDAHSNDYITTRSLSNPKLDVAVDNAAALDVAALLRLEHDGKSLLAYIKENNPEPLKPFSKNEKQIQIWLGGFRKTLESDNVSSHKYAKQIYFPIANKRYHLISPLFSSSLAQGIHERIAHYKYSEDAKTTRKARKENQYHPGTTVDFPNTAIQSMGGSKPQNVSQLNSLRGGRVTLFSSAPPTWESQSKPPLNTKTVFSYYHFGAKAWPVIKQLRNYLDTKVDRGSNRFIRKTRERFIDQVIDLLIQYSAQIHNIKESAGWSALPECRLNQAEQLWLDPYRNDDDFQAERNLNDWQPKVTENFAFWLNRELNKARKLTLGDIEHQEWKSLLSKKLQLLRDDLEVFA